MQVLSDLLPAALQTVYISCQVSSHGQKTIVGVKMKVLVVFLLAVLGSGLTDGRIVSKCELKDEVMKAIATLSDKIKQKGLTAENLVAKSKYWLLLLH